MPSGIYTRTKKIRRSLSESRKKSWQDPKYREEKLKTLRSLERRRKTSESLMGHIGGFKGKHHTEATKRRMSKIISKSIKKLWQNSEYKERHHKAMLKWYSKYSNCIHISPTKPERRLRNDLNKMFPGDNRFVGDGKIWIVGKNPDFMNVNGQKKIIEMFGNWWHSKEKTGRTKKEEENQRINHFAKYGYKTLIVWQRELNNIPELKRKLTEFHEG